MAPGHCASAQEGPSVPRNVETGRQAKAKEAVYLLFGLLPIEAEIHVRVLRLYGAITRLHPHSPLAEVAFRQVSGQGNASTWFMYVRKICKIWPRHHCLGAACAPWQAHGWKRLVNGTIRQHWFRGLMAGAGGKSSLCWLDVQLCQLGKPHPLWPRGAAVHVLESQQDTEPSS